MGGPDDAQETILSRLRDLGRRADPAAIASELEALGRGPAARFAHGSPSLTFLVNVLRNHGEIRGAENRSDAVACIGEYVAGRYGRRKVVSAKDHRLAALPWREAGVLPRFGLVENGDAVSISYARRGIAETGSVVLYSGRDNPVSNSLLPEDHIVLLDAADLHERLEDAWPDGKVASGAALSAPRCVHIISGPSSTADIALNMVYGAHGPRAWLVILIGADAPALARAARGRESAQDSPRGE